MLEDSTALDVPVMGEHEADKGLGGSPSLSPSNQSVALTGSKLQASLRRNLKWHWHVLPPACVSLWHIASTRQGSRRAYEIKLYLGGKGEEFSP